MRGEHQYSKDVVRRLTELRSECIAAGKRNFWQYIADTLNAEFGLDFTRTSATMLYVNRIRRGKSDTADKPVETKWRETRERDSWIIEARDSRICTVDDALRKAGVDRAIWEVDRFVVNGYDVTMKLKKNGEDEPFRAQNQQIKIFLKRKVPKQFADAAAMLIDRMKRYSPKYPKPTKRRKIINPHMVEMTFFDMHFGKLAWAQETGQDWDLKIAEDTFTGAVDELLGHVDSYQIEHFSFPLGQDFFHVDNASRTTINGTILEDADNRYAKIFTAGCIACVKAIDKMRAIAPVHVKWIPGNHDRTSSWHLSAYLDAWYRRCDDVTFDISPRLRKYDLYGITLLGYTHGDEEKHDSLPTIMASEVPDLWAASKHREWHVGHLHKKRQVRYTSTDSHVGVQIVVLPSLCGTDYWHYKKGFVGNQRAAEAYLWNKKSAYSGHFAANV